MKRAVIIGATSGIGREVAKQLLLQGWHLGIAGRRLPSLEALQSSAPDRVEVAALDVTQPDAAPKLSNLIRRVGGMDLFLLSSGIGYQNIGLNWKPPVPMWKGSPVWWTLLSITSVSTAADNWL